MYNKPTINHRQLAWLTSSFITSIGILSIHHISFQLTNMDAWFTYLLPLLYTFIVAAFFAYLIRWYPSKNLFEIVQLVFGKMIGTILNSLLIIYFWFIVLKDIYLISSFTTTILLEHTPIEFIILLFCLLLMYFGRKNIEVIARVNDIFYPLFILSLCVMPFLLANRLSLTMLEPSLTLSMTHWVKSNLLSSGAMGDVFVLGIFLHALCNQIQFRSAMKFGATLGILLLTLLLVLEIMVFGPLMPSELVYPGYALIQMIRISEFLDRVDLILFSIWLPTLTCKIITSFLALLLGVQHIIHSSHQALLNKPLSLWIVISAYFGFGYSAGLNSFTHMIMPVLSLSFQLLLIVSIYLVLHLKRYKISSSQMANLSTDSPRLFPWSLQTMKQPHLVWLFGCFISIAVGLSGAVHFPWLARICAVSYALFLILLVFSSYQEMKKSIATSK